jgi:hypothetical protein
MMNHRNRKASTCRCSADVAAWLDALGRLDALRLSLASLPATIVSDTKRELLVEYVDHATDELLDARPSLMER